MYLSRVRVATEGLDRRKLLSLLHGDAYSNHQLLWRLFSDDSHRSFLFRQETENEQFRLGVEPRGLPLFYVLSESRPVAVPGLLDAESKPFSPVLTTGDRLIFRLRANPTVTRKTETGRSVRHDVLMDAKTQCRQQGGDVPEDVRRRMEEAAIHWLADRSAKAGFALESAPQVTAYRQHANKRKGADIRFSSLDYEGVLKVTDLDLFNQTLRRGIGKSKAFGCGLMMVRRA